MTVVRAVGTAPTLFDGVRTMYELRQWLQDVKFAFEIYGYIRRSTGWKVDRQNNRLELEWHSGRRKSAMDRVTEHRASQGLKTHR